MYPQPEYGDQRATTLSGALKQEIARRKIPQDRAAELIGVSQQQVSRWLDGARPKVGSHEAIASFLGWEVEEVTVALPANSRRRREADASHLSIASGPSAMEVDPKLVDEPADPAASLPVNDRSQDQEIVRSEYIRIFLKRWEDGPLPDEVVVGVYRLIFDNN